MHHSTTESLTFDPYTRPIGRVLTVLRHLSAVRNQRTLQLTNRELADLAHCSAGSLPSILRQLEADGYVERITSAQQGTLIALCADAGDAAAGRSMLDQRHDQNLDQAHGRDPDLDQTEAGIPQQGARSNSTQAPGLDQKLIPPCTPHKEIHDSSMQQQHARARDFARQDAAIRERLRQLNIIGGAALDAALAAHRFTLADIEQKVASIASRTDIHDPTRFLYAVLISGEPVYSAAELAARQQEQEAVHGDPVPEPTRPPRGARAAPDRAGRYARSAPHYGSVANSERDAEHARQLAEFERLGASV